ncbi:MAG: hypothetical protein K2L54_00760 [Clostridiales bacterium]|nr:hypothetical protein [Clostridiales bacterium]
MFIADAFSAAWSYNLNAYIMNGLSLLLFVILTLIACGLIYFAVCRLVGFGSGQSMGASLNIVGSFLFISSVIAGAIIFGSSFALSREVMFSIAAPLFAGVVVVRTTVLAACEFFAHRKVRRENIDNIDNVENGENTQSAGNAKNIGADGATEMRGANKADDDIDSGVRQNDGAAEDNNESV